ncbi:hypothetical protein ABKN59_004876 [Abortiporus biennis]
MQKAIQKFHMDCIPFLFDNSDSLKSESLSFVKGHNPPERGTLQVFKLNFTAALDSLSSGWNSKSHWLIWSPIIKKAIGFEVLLSHNPPRGFLSKYMDSDISNAASHGKQFTLYSHGAPNGWSALILMLNLYCISAAMTGTLNLRRFFAQSP